MSKKMRMLQILNLWRLIPAYLIVYVSNNKAIIFDEIQHWKKCTGHTEKDGFNIFSSLMLELKEYRTLLLYPPPGDIAIMYDTLLNPALNC